MDSNPYADGLADALEFLMLEQYTEAELGADLDGWLDVTPFGASDDWVWRYHMGWCEGIERFLAGEY